MTSKKPCKACMTIPPVVSSGYETKGNFQEIGGLKTYVVSTDPAPTTGVLFIYDVFGYSDQAFQGADLLATTIPGHTVVIPDFHKGEKLPAGCFPPNTEEKKKTLFGFMGESGPASIPGALEATAEFMKALKSLHEFSTIQKWGIVGFCWGGKVATLSSIQTNEFTASAQVHPARLDRAEIEKLNEPHLILASSGEDEAEVLACAEILAARKDQSRTEHYKERIHGWMGARANLENGDEKLGYEEGYKELIAFFKETLA